MNVLHNIEAEAIKEPSFDRPEGTDPGILSISEGTRVSLVYHGKRLSAQVTAIERLGTSFVGCAREFAQHEACHDDLASGDFFRFRPKDVCEID